MRPPPSPVFFVLLPIAIAWALGELIVLRNLPRWVRFMGFRLASFEAELADRYTSFPNYLSGLEVSRLEDDSYLIETLGRGAGGTLEDASLANLAYAIVRVDGRHWTMDVRANRGYQVTCLVVSAMGLWAGVMEPRSPLARAGVLAFAAVWLFAVVKWRRTVRKRFAAVVPILAGGPA